MIAKPNQPKHLHWCIVLAALTCVSASPSIVDPETIFAGSSASKHPLGVVGQSDARVKRYLTTTLTTTESMDDNNEDRGINVASVIDQGLAARVTESVETGLRETAVIPGEAPNNSVIAEKVEESVETAVTPGVAAKDPVIAEKIEESDKGGVIPGVAARDHDPAAKVGKSVEKTVDSRTREPPNVPVDSDQLFKKVMGDQIAFYRNGENLFKSDEYAKWSTSVEEEYKTASSAPLKAEVVKASTLLAIYDKDVVLSMLAAGRKDPSTQKIAKNLEIGLLRKWSSDHNVDNIMDLLTFDKGEVLMAISLELWFTYLKIMKMNPYELFVTHFTRRYSDKELAELLVVAEANDETRTIATVLAKYQLKHWKNNGIRVIRSFKLLELNEVHLDALLRSPILSTWIDYVKMLGWDPYQVLFLAMRKRVGDKKLDSILAAAKADGTNASILGNLLNMQEKHQFLERLKREYPQMEGWQRDGKSGDDVFDILDLSSKGKYMFETDEWNSWVAYLTFLEKQQGSNDQREIAADIFSVLKNRFSSEDLVKLVATAKTVERTKEFAGEWERSNWRITKRTPDEVFDLLQLKEKGDGVFESPEFMYWALYVKELNSVRSRDDNVEMVYQLYRHYGPDLERMLQQAEKTAIARNDEVTKASVNGLRKGFESITSLEERPLKRKKPDETSLEERPLKRKKPDETSLEKKGLGKRLRTSPPELPNEENAGRI